jgi:hypothetical protein
MSFSRGFEKTAGALNPANIVGKAAGYSARGAAATTRVGKKVAENTAEVIKTHSAKQKAEFMKGFKDARGAAPAKAAGGAKDKGPSWASRHPYATAGLLYLGTKAMLGGGEKENNAQPPQYIGPQ